MKKSFTSTAKKTKKAAFDKPVEATVELVLYTISEKITPLKKSPTKFVEIFSYFLTKNVWNHDSLDQVYIEEAVKENVYSN